MEAPKFENAKPIKSSYSEPILLMQTETSIPKKKNWLETPPARSITSLLPAVNKGKKYKFTITPAKQINTGPELIFLVYHLNGTTSK